MTLFLVQLFCAVISCTPRQPAPVPVTTSATSLSAAYTAFDNHIEPPDHGPPVIRTSTGWVQGTHMKTIKGRDISAFMGIPYAKPPLGDLRFRSPVPVESWEGFYSAEKPGPVCLQVDATQFYLVMGKEDCLHLSIYTPKTGMVIPGDELLPVIFFLHGGAYFFGSSDLWGPAYLLDRDVILVTVNFRQGVLGFFSTGDDAAPGNFGLKDQALALKWIVNNIEHFGGDPRRITHMGVASGASIANLNLISKHTRDHVSSIILHSGSAHLHWSLVNRTIENSRKVASQFGCKTENSHVMVECLRKQNPHFVANSIQKVYKVHEFPWVNFGPVIEQPGPDAYLVETPFEAYAANRVKPMPLLGGIVESEGDVFVHSLLKIIWKPEVLLDVNNHWYSVAPYLFDFHDTALDPTDVATRVKQYYLQNDPISYTNRDRISRAIGDRFIVQGAYKGLQIHSRIAPTYAYFFDFPGIPSVTSTLKFNRQDWGVTHTDDLLYLFNSTLLYAPLKVTDPEFKISEFMTEAWVNFAASGKPVGSYETEPLWAPVSDPLDMQVLEINQNRRMIPFPFRDRMGFWASLNLQFDYNLYPAESSSAQVATGDPIPPAPIPYTDVNYPSP